MNASAAGQAPKRNVPLLILTWIVSIGGGVGGAYLLLPLIKAHAPWEDVVSVFLGAWLIAIVPIGELRRAALPGIGFDGLRIAGAVSSILTGLILMSPVIVPPSVDRTWLYAAAAVITLISIVISLQMNKKIDELLRAISRETSVIALIACQAGLFLYAFANRLGLVHEVTPWGLYLIGMAVYYASAFVVIFRRGLDRQPRE